MQTGAVIWSTRKTVLALIPVCIAAAAPAPLLADCAVKQVAQLPIDMQGREPTIAVQLNGRDARLMLDSGAFWSTITAATAAENNLKLTPAPSQLRVQGVDGGYTETSLTTVKNFGVLGATLHNFQFLVGGSQIGGAGLLGQNFLETFDDEYDLARGAVRLFKTEGCAKTVLAYWASPGQSYSVVNISRGDLLHPHTIGDALVNGKPIRVMFDTGAFSSLLSLKAAERAGVKPDSPGVVDAGYAIGYGRGKVKSYLARFDSLKIGDSEEIKNSRLRFGELKIEGVDMLLGADFFLSHRIFVSNKEHKVFLTYNGGAVFDLSKSPASAASEAASGTGDADAETSVANTQGGDAPTDAAGFARRGEGFAARQDFPHALADLSKACELKADEPEYFYRRALVYLQTGNAAAALADLNQALKLKQDFLPAYLPRAEIYLHEKNVAAAQTDLGSVDRMAPKQADLRLELGHIYAGLDNFTAATAEFDFWIDSHLEDARLVGALSSRCLMRMLQNQDLNLAMDDCNKALRRSDKHEASSGQIYAHRGMVHLRQGDYDKAIGDFNDALKLQPKDALALYGRGVAESRKNQSGAASADIAAARDLQPKLAERYQRFGIAP
jgi:tetratricopeptide (TPR) repeat protein